MIPARHNKEGSLAGSRLLISTFTCVQTPGDGFENAASHFNGADGGVALCAAATHARVLLGIVGVLAPG